MLRWAPQIALGRVTAVLESAGQLSALGAIAVLSALQASVAPMQFLLGCSLAMMAACVVVWLCLGRRRDE
jgi:hypothetical protein